MTIRKSTKKSESSREKYFISYSPTVMYRLPEDNVKREGYTRYVPYAIPESYPVGNLSKHQREILTKDKVWTAGYAGFLYDTNYNPVYYGYLDARKYRVRDIPISENAYNKAIKKAYNNAIKKTKLSMKEFPDAFTKDYTEEVHREFGDLARRTRRARLRRTGRTSLRR